jgi:hypothetical protein
VSLTQYKPTRKEIKMAAKKGKKIKLQDLKPKKDTKGGVGSNNPTGHGPTGHGPRPNLKIP